ncbi:MAG: hypothetical protein HYR84_04000 [Planctomycetes bacterium]|nr:hypothetical protein [Planctomycetota bacterium]
MAQRQNIQNSYAQIADFTCSSTTNETDMLGTANAYNGTLDFAANTLGIGDHIFLWAAGLVTCYDATSPITAGSLTLRLKFGGATLSTGAMNFPSPSSGVSTYWRFHGMIACRNTEQRMCLVFETDNVIWPSNPTTRGSSPSLDRTIANSLQLTAPFGLSDASNLFRVTIASVEFRSYNLNT